MYISAKPGIYYRAFLFVCLPAVALAKEEPGINNYGHHLLRHTLVV